MSGVNDTFLDPSGMISTVFANESFVRGRARIFSILAFAFLTLPLSALILSVIFAFRRGYVVFDHLIFSIHSLCFQGLLFVTIMGLQALAGDAAWWLLLASPLHLYKHMRGVYLTGRVGTLVRMSVLWAATVVAFGLLMLGLVVLGLAALRG